MDAIYPDLETIWPGWKIEKILGHGLGGTVYRAVRSVNGIVMKSAVKIIFSPEDQPVSTHVQFEGAQDWDMETYKSKAEDGLSEISYLLELRNCSHVVNIEDFSLVKRNDAIGWNVYIRMELLRSLMDYLSDRQRLTENEIIKLGLDFSDVLLQFEKNKIVYRDFKLENTYITEDGCFKLGDFGIAIRMDEAETVPLRGNQNYMAPEAFWKKETGKTTDIYSLGILMYMLANGNKLPFMDSEYLKGSREEQEQASHRRLHGEKIPDARYALQELNRIILKACNYDPEKRYPNAEAFYEDLKRVRE